MEKNTSLRYICKGCSFPGRAYIDGDCHVCVEKGGLYASIIPYLPVCVFLPKATS